MAQDKTNQQGHGGGPKTAVGKSISSQNALTHGVTSTKIVSIEETQSYHDLMNEFKAAYPSHHPTIKLQTERVVMTRIQLKRVQGLIHAQHLKSQVSSVVEKELGNELMLDENAKELEYYQRMNLVTLDLVYLSKILSEIIIVGEQEIEDPQTFFNQMPNLFKHIEQEAISRDVTVDKYMDRLIKRKRNQGGIELIVVTKEEAKIIQERSLSRDIQTEFIKLSVEDILDLIHVIQRDLMKSLDTEMKIKEFRTILPIVQEANLPNLEVLDKLTRYQTTLNNQLSKQLGELIELEKRYGDKD